MRRYNVGMSAAADIVLACLEPGIATGAYSPFSFGARRMFSAFSRDPGLRGAGIRLVERADRDVEGWALAIAEGGPRVIGLSAFVWSFPFFHGLIRRLRQLAPQARIVMGGPSARPVMWTLAPFRDRSGWPDALDDVRVDLSAAPARTCPTR